MINYNLILYIGIAFFMVGFLLFLFCQYKIRDCEIAEFKNEQLHQSFIKQKEKEQFEKRYWKEFKFPQHIKDKWGFK